MVMIKGLKIAVKLTVVKLFVVSFVVKLSCYQQFHFRYLG
jgi:hypothetical protein